MKYWLNNGGEQSYGPYEVEQLRAFQGEGRIGGTAQLCAEGSTQWVPAASVLGQRPVPNVPVAQPAPPPVAAPPGIEGEFPLAPFGKRAGAFAIDIVILVVAGILVTLVIENPLLAVTQSFGFAATVGFLLRIVAGWLYFVLLEISPRQGTLGKILVEIKVTDASGNRLGFGQATGRYFSKCLSGLILGVGFFFPLWTPRKQALHDIIAGTLVLRGERS